MVECEWQVDEDGYEWAPIHAGATLSTRSRGGSDQVLQPRGGPLRFYCPFDEPGLARRFARIGLGQDAARGFANEFGLLDTGAGARFSEISARRRALTAVFTVLDLPNERSLLPAAQAAAGLFNYRFRPHPTLEIDYLSAAVPRLVLRASSLWQALLIQAAQAIIGAQRIVACKRCGDPIPLGPGKGTARREYCSQRCKVAWNRQQQREGRGP
jgi:hypothetical protein